MSSEIQIIQSETATRFQKDALKYALSIEDGWDFRIGDPEIFANKEKFVIPDGKVLDLGIGGARTSIFFAMHGMEVNGIDIDHNRTMTINDLAQAYNLPIHAETGDITKGDFGKDIYDVVVISQTFVHFPDSGSAYKTLEKAIHSLKPGGKMYLRTAGKRDIQYLDAQNRWVEWSTNDPCVYYELCGCSGEVKMEPHLYFDEIELMHFLEVHGMHILYSQVMPEKSKMNVMYGEDWHMGLDPDEQSAMITLLLEKQI